MLKATIRKCIPSTPYKYHIMIHAKLDGKSWYWSGVDKFVNTLPEILNYLIELGVDVVQTDEDILD